MDFVVGLPRCRSGHDTIWVIVDRLTKSAHFLPIKNSDSLDKLAQLYVREIIRLHVTSCRKNFATYEIFSQHAKIFRSMGNFRNL